MSYIKNADCFDEFKNIKNESVDFVCVDLPYGQTECGWDTVIDLKQMWEELKRICKEGCIYAFFCTVKFGNTLINSNPKWFRYDLVWEKSRGVGYMNANKAPLRRHEMIYIFGYSGDDLKNERNLNLRAYAEDVKKYINTPLTQIDKLVGNQGIHHFWSFKSTQFGIPTLKNYNKLINLFKINEMKGYKEYKDIKSEWVKANHKTYNPQKTPGKPWKTPAHVLKVPDIYGQLQVDMKENKTGDRHPTSILKFNNPTVSVHPTQKPLLLCEWLIKTYSNKNDLVLDFCMGSGTTIKACINTERQYIGIEKDNLYFKTVENRININA
tara:strand:+ start:4489 stop:5463 length:975 start_codon:yes stop_codon:yes gene_type:complete